MRVPPPAVWATYPEPNYTHPDTRGPTLLIINIILITLVTIAVVGRLYSRLYIRRWFGADDIIIIPAFIFDVGLTAVVLLANFKYGWDRHIYDLPTSMIPPAQKIAFAAKILFTLAATCIRLSLICFYYRLVKDSKIKWFRGALHVSVIWNMAVCVTFIILTIWLCTPVQSYWMFPPTGHCMSEGKVMLGGGVLNSVTDLWTTVLPIPIVMRLQMPLRQRIGVSILLCMGGVATIAGAARTYFTWKSLLANWDETWWAYWLWVAAAVEIHLGMICACAPAWKSILQDPLKSLSSKLSEKLSSLRSPSHSPHSSTTAKPGLFNPLRSLPWFQITRLDFERSRLDTEDESTDGKFGSSANARSQSSRMECTSSKATHPAMRIAMRRSIEQSSTRLEESPVLPEKWLLESRAEGS